MLKILSSFKYLKFTLETNFSKESIKNSFKVILYFRNLIMSFPRGVGEHLNTTIISDFRTFISSPLLGLRQFVTTENPLNMMKNAIYFMLKALFILNIFTFLS